MDRGFSLEVCKLLTEAGWEPHRRVDVGSLVERIGRDAGKPVPKYVRETLSEFHGLRIVASRYCGVNFDTEITALGYAEECPYLTAIVGQTMYPLGSAMMVNVYIGEDDRVLVLDMDWLHYYLFGSLGEYLENALMTHPGQPELVPLRDEQRPAVHREG